MSEYITDNTRKMPYAPASLLTREHYDQVILGGIYTASPFSADGLDYETRMMGTEYYSPYDNRCWVFQAMQDPSDGRIWLIDTFNARFEKDADGNAAVAFSRDAFQWRWRLDESVWNMFTLRMEDVSDWEPADSYGLYDPADIVHGVCFGPGNHSLSCDDWKRKGAEPSLTLQIGHLNRELGDAISSALAKARWAAEIAGELEGLLRKAEDRGIDYTDEGEELAISDLLAGTGAGSMSLDDFLGGDMRAYLASRCAEPGEIYEENGFAAHVYTGCEMAWELGQARTFTADEGELGQVAYLVSHLAVPERDSLLRVLHRNGKVATAYHHDLTEDNVRACLDGGSGLFKMESFGPEHANRDALKRVIMAKRLGRAAEEIGGDQGDEERTWE